MASGSTQLGDLKIAVVDAAEALAAAFAQGTTFATLPAGRLGPAAQLLPQPLTLSGNDALTLGPAKLALGAAGSYQLWAFSGQFTDPDGIAAPAAGQAWLKHVLAAQVSGDVDGTAAGVTFGLQSGATAQLLDYRRHAATDAVATAVLGEIAQPRLPWRIQDLTAMGEGDAVALVAAGNLAFRGTFTYASMLAASISALDKVLGVAGATAFGISTGGTVEVDFGAKDAFRLVFTRGKQLDLAVAVQKTTGSNAAATASLGVQVKFTDAAQLADLLESYVEGRLGTPWKDLQALADKAVTVTDPAQLSPAEQALLQQIAGRLGWDGAIARFEQIRDQLVALPGKLNSALVDALSKTLKVGFTVSYSRVASGETLVSFEAAAAALTPYLTSLLVGDLAQVTDRLAARDPQFVLLDYLSTEQVTSDLAFGFNLTIGGWGAASGRQLTSTFTRQTNVDQQQRLSYDSRQRYTSQWGQAGETYGLELAASMAAFAAPPSGGDFAFSANLAWTWDQTLTADLARRILDLASVWQVAGAAATAGSLAGALAPLIGQEVHAEVALVLGDEGVRRLAVVPEPQAQAAWRQAMADALPPLQAGSSLLRLDLGQRRSIYTGVAAATFAQQSPTDGLVAVPAYDQAQPPLAAADRQLLRAVDLSQDPPGNLAVYSLAALWRPDSSTVSSWRLYQRLDNAWRSLGRFLSGQTQSPDVVAGAFSQVQAVVGQDYAARLWGSFLAQVLGGAVGLVAGSLNVAPKAAGGTAIVIGGGGGAGGAEGAGGAVTTGGKGGAAGTGAT